MPFFFINCMLFLLRFMKIKKININSYFKFHEKTIQQAIYKLRHLYQFITLKNHLFLEIAHA